MNKMEKIIKFVAIVLINNILEAFCTDIRVFSDEDVLLTNYSTNGNDTPDDCYLFGSEFRSSDPLNNIYMNTTHQGSFWVHATISFKRNINPIGVLYNCKENRLGNFSLDECSSECKGFRYFSHGMKSCQCTMNKKQISEGLEKIDSCGNDYMGLCSSGQGCVLYQQITRKQDYVCGTYTFNKLNGFSIWLFQTKSCRNKENGFICQKGPKSSVHGKNASYTWYEAYQKCKDSGHDLLPSGKVNIDQQFKDGKTYWVSFLRRQKVVWGNDYNPDLCVAASIEANGSLTFTSKLCSEELPSLCYRNMSSKTRKSATTTTGGGSMTAPILGGVFGGLMLVVLFLIGLKKCRRTRKLKYMESIIKENSVVEEKETCENKEVSIPPSSVYSLAGTYSDPINSVSIDQKAQVQPVPSEYAEVNYNTKSTKTTSPERQLIENPYQMPVA